ncbi:uncharacterized protein LOC120129224 [Hibiscus syriacus]|uniref:uncharacterized protein LOC120129224 n=1 Tax=Hibiscus syriacus TaxID=106335 RepID=UPI0019215470|nr:uncharacterized protein LOC120129224 [Hibiscus syriacus]
MRKIFSFKFSDIQASEERVVWALGLFIGARGDGEGRGGRGLAWLRSGEDGYLRGYYGFKFKFNIQAGSDSTEVATDMITINSTVKMIYRSTGTFFGVHVISTPLDLSYSQITIASGTKFYQSRKSQRSVTVTVTVMGNKVPLYRSGASLSSSTGMTTHSVSLKLSFIVRSRAYVLGKLVKPKFNKKIERDITYDPKKPNAPISLKKSCTYDS